MLNLTKFIGKLLGKLPNNIIKEKFKKKTKKKNQLIVNNSYLRNLKTSYKNHTKSQPK